MAIKLVDELKAMGNFPIAHAEGINLVKTDGTEDNLQNLFDNGELGGGDDSVTLTQQEYEALSEEQKLDGLYYTYDTKRIYKNGIQYGASEPIPLTMEEYKALKEAGAIDEQQEYLIEADAEGILLGAEDIGYNNAESGIQATTVQGAIDKVVEKVDEVKIELTEYVDNKAMYVSDESDTYINMTAGHHCTMYFTIYGNTMTIFAIQRASNDGRTIAIKYPLPFKELPTIKITYGTPAGNEKTNKNTLTEWEYDQNYGMQKQNEMHFMIQGKI